MPFMMITVISSSLSVTLEIHIEFLSKNSTTTRKNMIQTISTCLMNNQNVPKCIRRYHIRVFSPQKSFCRQRKRVSKITVESWRFVKYVGDEKPKVWIDIYDAYEDIFICMTPENSSDRRIFARYQRGRHERLWQFFGLWGRIQRMHTKIWSIQLALVT